MNPSDIITARVSTFVHIFLNQSSPCPPKFRLHPSPRYTNLWCSLVRINILSGKSSRFSDMDLVMDLLNLSTPINGLYVKLILFSFPQVSCEAMIPEVLAAVMRYCAEGY